MMARAFSGLVDDAAYLSTYLRWMAQAYPVYQWLAVLDTTPMQESLLQQGGHDCQQDAKRNQ